MSKTLPITKYRKFDAFQAVYEVHPAKELSDNAMNDPKNRYKRTILHLSTWLKKRYSPDASQKYTEDKAGTEERPVIPLEDEESLNKIANYLNLYPEIEEYADFDICNMNDLDYPEIEDLHICNYSDEEICEWTLILIEPGRGNNITLSTEVSVRTEGDQVFLAVKGSKKLPVGGDEGNPFFRPAFLRDIIVKDPLIKLSEAGLPYDYCYGNAAVHINGKSDSDITLVLDGLLDNVARQLPVYLLSGDTFDDLGGEGKFMPEIINSDQNEESAGDNTDKKTEDPDKVREFNKERQIMDAVAQAILGYGTVLVIDRSVRKLYSHEGYKEYVDLMEKGNIIRRGSSADKEDISLITPDLFKKYFKIDEKKRMQGKIVSECRNLMEHKRYDFGKLRFYREIRSIKREEEFRSLFGGPDQDPVKLKALIESLERQNKDLQSELSQEKEEHYSEQDRLISENEKLKKENEKLKNHNADLKESKIRLTEEKQNLSGQVETMMKDSDSATVSPSGPSEEEVCKKHEALFDVPVRKEGIAEWIRDNYHDTIVLTDRACAAMSKDSRDIDLNMLTYMIHYIHGYTLARSEGLSPDGIKEYSKKYDVMNKNFDIDLVGDAVSAGSTTSKEDQKKYDLDIETADGKTKTVKMNLHIKKGHTPDSLLRIYFYYDPDRKKSIIGYMPDHLPTRSGGHT